ncbi:phosphoribosyltransferase family protein [Pyrolobus fumarii]|nr:phosphoribosyltransferase family protein [Pyrolobus fumarii]
MSWVMLVHFFDPIWDSTRYARYGLIGLSHRGVHEAEAIVMTSDGIDGPHIIDLRGIQEKPLELPRGSTLLAAPAGRIVKTRTKSGEEIGLAVDGPCDVARVAESIGGKANDASPESLRDAIAASLDLLRGCTLVAIGARGSFAIYRSKLGLRPLSYGAYGFDAFMAATESVAIELMGGIRRGDLPPGTIIYGDQEVLDEEVLEGGGVKATCLYEYVYIARPDSVVDGVPIYLYRREAGERLARHHDADVDVVVGVPETALPYAVGYAEAKGARLELGFVSSIGRLRTGLMEDVEERMVLIHLKLNPVKGVFEGKRVAVVDDSLVTGITLKTVARLLRLRYGATEVHVAIGSPLVSGSCPYGLVPWEESRLAAANLRLDEIRYVLEADSFASLPLKEALAILEKWDVKPCAACMGGEAPRA